MASDNTNTCLYPRRDPETACGYAHATQDTAVCKHCDGPIHRSSKASDGAWVHSDGDQVRLHTCPVSPYGFHAEPVGTACERHRANPCNGARGMEVRTDGQ
ncbi:hypothetical protein [Nocardia sp. NPDC049149]|uniref:hypothetical protein n=1 Tax=Nocardia sp. NPDC049149 TaxID=3364315 RepID=UPI0037243FE8